MPRENPPLWKKRLQARARSRRYRANHPEKIAEANRAARRNGAQAAAAADPNRDRERRQERFFRLNKNAGVESPLAERSVSRAELHRPSLYFLDKNGRLHKEDTRSAEQVIEEEAAKCTSPKPS